jgi:hypothetical protein
MVFYDFKCDTCENESEIEFDSFVAYDEQMKESPVKCEKCSAVMRRLFTGKASSIYIPEHMKAGTEDNRTYEYANKLMKNAPKPSGKTDKIYY